MAKRLLDRQAKLLAYLTSGEAIFGDKSGIPIDPALRGIDRALLHVEARFSHEKRMEKIAAVFPKTFALLGADLETVLRAFVEACPPFDISRIENARQLYGFLTAHWESRPPAPPYLPDVAACELACAQACIEADSGSEVEIDSAHIGLPAIRRKPGVILLQTRFDIRPLFESGRDTVDPIESDVRLAIAVCAGEPQILELTPEIFDLLAALDGWVVSRELANAEGLIAELAEAGVLEVRR